MWLCESKNGECVAKIDDMTLESINICGFEPCGYSLNSIGEADTSIVHVIPEDGFSYASVEVAGCYFRVADLDNMTRRVLACFQPDEFFVSVHVDSGAKFCDKICIIFYTTSFYVDQLGQIYHDAGLLQCCDRNFGWTHAGYASVHGYGSFEYNEGISSYSYTISCLESFQMACAG